jgi:hypothetical protein
VTIVKLDMQTWAGIVALIAAAAVLLLRPFSGAAESKLGDEARGWTFNDICFWLLFGVGVLALVYSVVEWLVRR